MAGQQDRHRHGGVAVAVHAPIIIMQQSSPRVHKVWNLTGRDVVP